MTACLTASTTRCDFARAASGQLAPSTALYTMHQGPETLVVVRVYVAYRVVCTRFSAPFGSVQGNGTSAREWDDVFEQEVYR